MSESTTRYRATTQDAGKSCPWCQEGFEPDVEVASCRECRTLQHASCWDRQLGCARAECMNAPLTRLDAGAGSSPAAVGVGGWAAAGGGAAADGTRLCHACKSSVPAGEELCPVCDAINSPDGLYHGPKVNPPNANQPLIYGILGLFICAPIFGSIAIAKANELRQVIRSSPRYGGHGLATAGMVLGIIDWVLFVVVTLAKVSG